jgi:hypothetical protein
MDNPKLVDIKAALSLSKHEYFVNMVLSGNLYKGM